MDDLGSLIGSFLGNPENIEKLKVVLDALSKSSSGPPGAGNSAQPAGETLPQADAGDAGADVSAAPPAPQDAAETAAPAALQAAAAPPQFSADMLKSAFAQLPVAEDDKRAMLLKALRPYMSQKRAGYVDTAMGILSLTKILGKMK